jgi:protein O-GlcNAc transferase
MADICADGNGPRAFSMTEMNEPDGAARQEPEPPAKPVPATASVSPAPKSAAPIRPAGRIAYEACPLCNSPDISSYKETDCTQHPHYDPALPPLMIWCRCSSCEHVFTQGYFSTETAEALVAKAGPERVGQEAEAQRLASARIVGKVARYKAGGDWLDVGFGNGSLLFTAEEWGFRAVGTDPRPDHVQSLKGLGFEAYGTPIDKIDFPGRFSVVSLTGRLERAPFPRLLLDGAHRLLQPGGVLFASMPNMATMVWRLRDTGGGNSAWGDVQHYHSFTRKRLYALLQTHGFKPAAYAVGEAGHSMMEVLAVRS